ncbi:hypothetical protein H2201_006906 [Coniosporium apollinis]|uniref:DUF1772 domain-containing protein n=1 Tax=Coniosporium apollinis TaxID=61459 RepID=A0ABQ9NS71_9PEZI|nr:hypothetical protein H2201_006906 [Coniosporium apollinis]
MTNLFLLTFPVLIETSPSTTVLLQQWKRIFLRGHIQGPALSVTTGLIYAYAAYAKSQQGQNWKGLAIAGATTVSMIPYTWTVMTGTNNKLWAAATGEAKLTVGSREAQGLINRWSRLNAVRAMFPLAGGVLGLLSVLGVLKP